MEVLEGQTAVVTGAASGIGRALSERFAAEGMQVVLADRNASLLADAASAIEARFETGVLAVETDVTSQESLARLADATAERFGDVHVLCNNAGVLRSAPAWEQTLDDSHAVMDVNFWGVVHGIRAFVPAMLAHGAPCHVVNTSSFGGLAPLPNFSMYCASKFAVVGLSEALVLDLAAEGHATMGVSVLCPGGVETNIFAAEVQRRRADAQTGEAREDFERLAADDRKGKYVPSTIAEVVLDAIRTGTFYVIPAQAELRAMMERRNVALDDALTRLVELPVTQ